MFFKFGQVKRAMQKGLAERRKYLRLDADIPVHYFIIPKGKEEELESAHFHEVEGRNIGGGGLLLEIPVLSDELLLTTHLIKIQFTLPKDTKPIEAIARMVCVDKPEHVEGFYLRLAFVKINKEDQERLIKYIEKKHGKRWI